MDWLLSMALAGALFSASGDLPVANGVENQVDTQNQAVVLPEETERFEQIYSINPKIYAEKINLVREKNGWRIGNGAGKSYNFTADKGKIYIRGAVSN